MGVNSSCTLHFIELPLEFGKSQANSDQELAWSDTFKGALVNLSGARNTVELGCLGYVHVEHLHQLLSLVYFLCGSIIYSHGVAQKTKVFFIVRKHEQKQSTLVPGAILQNLVEQMANPFNLTASQSLDNLAQVIHPDVINMGPLEKLDSSLVHSEAFLEEIVGL